MKIDRVSMGEEESSSWLTIISILSVIKDIIKELLKGVLWMLEDTEPQNNTIELKGKL